MARYPGPSVTPLIATAVLALDDEAEHACGHLSVLTQATDPMIRDRLVMLRVVNTPQTVMAMPLVAAERTAVPALVGGMALQEEYIPVALPQPVQESALVRGDPEALLPLRQSLRAITERVLHSGNEPGEQSGYVLTPSELLVFVLGRADSPLLVQTAQAIREIAQTLTQHLQIQRIALLIVSPPSEDDSARNHSGAPAQRQDANSWQRQIVQQPWKSLLSWSNGEPPFHYAMLFDAWNEAGRHVNRIERHFAIAEAIWAMFSSGILLQPSVREAFDLSTAAMDIAGTSRLGAISAVQIGAPDDLLLDILSHRFAADVLIRRGLLGNAGGLTSTDTKKKLEEEAQSQVKQWFATTFRRNIVPDYYALPAGMPVRLLENGKHGEWYGLRLSTTSISSAALTWRWSHPHRIILNDEHFWNLVVQHEFETIREQQTWVDQQEENYDHHFYEMQQDLVEQIRWRTLGIHGAERARIFIRSILARLDEEEHIITLAREQAQQDLDTHHHALEERLHNMHPHKGIPQVPNPPVHFDVPRLPRSMEAIFHDIIDARFARTPNPSTLLLAGALIAIIGTIVGGPLLASPIAHYATPSLTAVFDHAPISILTGGLFLILFLLTLLATALPNIVRLYNIERSFFAERTLLWQAETKLREHDIVLNHIVLMKKRIGNTIQFIDAWMQNIEQAASQLLFEATIQEQRIAPVKFANDVFVVNGMIWSGHDVATLYHSAREQIAEGEIIDEFLRYIETHAQDALLFLQEDRIGMFALEYMRERLRATLGTDPFAQWSIDIARAALDQAETNARIPYQSPPTGRPQGLVEAVTIHPSIPWLTKIAAERSMLALPGASPRRCTVVRIATRLTHPLIGNDL